MGADASRPGDGANTSPMFKRLVPPQRQLDFYEERKEARVVLQDFQEKRCRVLRDGYATTGAILVMQLEEVQRKVQKLQKDVSILQQQQRNRENESEDP